MVVLRNVNVITSSFISASDVLLEEFLFPFPFCSILYTFLGGGVFKNLYTYSGEENLGPFLNCRTASIIFNFLIPLYYPLSPL